MHPPIPKVSLEGITLEMMVTHLVEIYGWEDLGTRITINCFTKDPSIKSSLTFLRKTPWARKKVEALYVKLKKAQLFKQAKKEGERASAVVSKSKDVVEETPVSNGEEGPWAQAAKRKGKRNGGS